MDSSYDDLKNGTEGDYRIKIAHTYLDGQTEPEIKANADTAYCGNVVLPDGTAVTSSYGRFGEKNPDGSDKTYIISKRINPRDTDELVGFLNNNRLKSLLPYVTINSINYRRWAL